MRKEVKKMKKINLDKIHYLRGEVAKANEWLANAIEAKARKRSEAGLAKAEREIANIKRWKERDEARLREAEAEAEEAKKLAAAGGEIVLARVWLDEYGNWDDKVNRSRWDSLEEAEAVYREAKRDNGNYVEAWIEVRATGEYERIKAIKEQIAALEAELKELSGDD